MIRMGNWVKSAVLVAGTAAISVLSACGGGGGSGGGGPVAPISDNYDTTVLAAPSDTFMPAGSGLHNGATQVESLASVRDTEFNAMGGALGAVRADYAFAYGIKGSGVSVAVLDTGIDLTHTDLVGSISTDSTSVIGGSVDELPSQTHGTRVAGMIAADENGMGMMGIAPESEIIAIKMSDDGSVGDQAQADAIAAAVNANAAIINISYGLGGFENLDLAGAIDQGVVSETLLTAYQTAIDADTLIVMAAGNASGPSPEWDAKIAGYGFSQGQILAVGAYDINTGLIAGFSHRAGDARNFYLVAPGSDLITTDNDGSSGYTGPIDGTSFASPLVAGAAALVKSAAPFLTAPDIAAILLTSADDKGAPGVDAVYGHGLLNVEAALTPQGHVVTPTGATASSLNGVSLAGTSAGNGPLAASLASSSALGSAMVLDGFARPYVLDLRPDSQASAANSAWGQSWLSKPFESIGTGSDLNTPLQVLRFSADPDSGRMIVAGGENWVRSLTGSETNGHFAVAGPAMGFAAQQKLGAAGTLRLGYAADLNGTKDQSAGLAFARLERKAGERAALGVTLGLSQETGQHTGGRLSGAFDTGAGNQTRFVALDASARLTDRWQTGLGYSFGRSADFSGALSLISGQQNVATDSAELWLAYREADRSLKLSVGRDLGFAGGDITLRVPVARTMDREGVITYADETLRLGDARRLRAAFSLSERMTDRLDMAFTAEFSANENDFSAEEFNTGLRFRYRF